MPHPPRIRRVALVGASHWHSIHDAAYLDLLAQYGAEIVGVADPDPAIADDRARRYGAVAFTDDLAMLARTRPEFVVALGRHADMPAIFRRIASTRIPFMMEKPWGVRMEDVRALAAQCHREGLWVAVPFLTRCSHWAQACRTIWREGRAGAPSHLVFRLIRPTARRYVEWDSPWMVERAGAGGGALTNLGAHGFDICRYITGEEPEVLSCVLSRRAEGFEVEDYAHVMLRTPSGLIVHNEVGYTLPTWPRNTSDTEQKLALATRVVRAVPGGVEHVDAHGTRVEPTPPEWTGGYRQILFDTLDAAARGDPPPAGPDDCRHANELIHAAYRLATWA